MRGCCCCCCQPSKMPGFGPKKRGSECFWKRLQPSCLPVEIGRPCCGEHRSKPRICSVEAQTACSEQTAQDSKIGGPMPLLAAQGRMAGQIGSKAPKQRPTNYFSAPVQTARAKQRPSAPPPLLKPAPVLIPGMTLRTGWVDLIGGQTSPPNVPRISNWIRPGCCGPERAPSAASLKIQFPRSEQIV